MTVFSYIVTAIGAPHRGGGCRPTHKNTNSAKNGGI